MAYHCTIYGLGVVANKPIPGVPCSSTAVEGLRIFFGSLPSWLSELKPTQIETSFVSDYKDEVGEPVLRVFSLVEGKYFWFCYSDKTEFVLDRAGTEIWAAWPMSLSLEDTCTYLLGPVMGFVMLLRGIVCLHASAVVIGNQAIALLGPAGSGKSTTAAAFSQRGYNILAEDVVTLDDGPDHFLVRPGYPCIRLWPESVEALYGSESHLPKLTPNWDKCYLELSDRFENNSLPLAAIYYLNERSEDPAAPFVETLDKSEGLMSMIANTYATKLMDKQMRVREFGLLTRLMKNVPLRRVTPHKDPMRIPELCHRILSDYELIRKKSYVSKGAYV